jgi:rhodanese-related sulfurtransferase
MEHSPRFLRLVDDARTRIRETAVADVQSRLTAGEALTLVDVREDSEWARGHVPGAVHAGKGVIERDAETLFPDLDAPLMLYCGGGYRSALAADALGRMGYTAVESMDGGFRAWTDAGAPVESPA